MIWLEQLYQEYWLHIWIIVPGVLAAICCALLGNFLVLRRMSMMGDAISHAVLPGLAVAFLITHSRGNVPMFIGAAVVGLLTAVLTQWVSRFGKVDEGASMGVVFTSLFALGLILIQFGAKAVDLDPGCVLYGAIETIPLTAIGGGVPPAVITLSIMLLVNAAFVIVFFKELKITSFDPALASTLGINSAVMHYALMALVAATTVACFEAVGSILVIAMLIAPPAAAHLLTDRLWSMILLSLVLAAASAVGGHLAAVNVPVWFGYSDTTTAGSIAAMAGFLFLLVMLFAPRHGLLSKLFHRAALSLSILREDLLGMLYRAEELLPGAVIDPQRLRQIVMAGPVTARLALRQLRQRGHIEPASGGYRLTHPGRQIAQTLLRSHRLWESYLAAEMKLRPDHTHATAERLEHITSRAMRDQLTDAAGAPLDPHGKPIPRED